MSTISITCFAVLWGPTLPMKLSVILFHVLPIKVLSYIAIFVTAIIYHSIKKSMIILFVVSDSESDKLPSDSLRSMFSHVFISQHSWLILDSTCLGCYVETAWCVFIEQSGMYGRSIRIHRSVIISRMAGITHTCRVKITCQVQVVGTYKYACESSTVWITK